MDDGPSASWDLSPCGKVSWNGGQAAFPGGWLELRRKDLAQPISAFQALEWKISHYVLSPQPFVMTEHHLDKSPATESLREKVMQWRQRASEWEPSPERKLYLSVADKMVEKLGKLEQEINEDYAAEIHALWHRGPEQSEAIDNEPPVDELAQPASSETDMHLCGLIDCHVREKTDALILKYVLAHPDSQMPAEQRPEGTIGGIGQATLSYLLDRMVKQQLQSVRMEGLSLKLYQAASMIGFRPIASKIPPMPQPSATAVDTC